MGLMRWLFGVGKGQVPSNQMQVAEIKNGPGTFEVDVVGESHYQTALERTCGGRTEDGHRFRVEAYLVPEDDNRYDSKAIRVCIDGETVGYLDRQTARSFRKKMAEAGVRRIVAKCNAVVVGGWDRGADDKGYFGVKLDLPTE